MTMNVFIKFNGNPLKTVVEIIQSGQSGGPTVRHGSMAKKVKTVFN